MILSLLALGVLILVLARGADVIAAAADSRRERRIFQSIADRTQARWRAEQEE